LNDTLVFRLLSGDHIALGRVHGSVPEERLGNASAWFLGPDVLPDIQPTVWSKQHWSTLC